MTDETVATLPRGLLSAALGGNPRVVKAFEAQAQVVVESKAITDDQAEATTGLQNATVLTLSANDVLANERIVVAGDGIAFENDGTHLTISASDTVAHVLGGFRIQLVGTAISTIVLPAGGTLATRSGTETLQNKTLDQPKLSGLGNYADDTAAAGGGVPVGGTYRNGSVLMVRVA